MNKWYLLLAPLVFLGAGCLNGSVTNEVPVLGNDDVDEMIVEEDGDAAGGTVEAGTPGAGEVNDTPETDLGLEIDPEAVVFDLNAFLFGYSEKELRVKKGQTVTVNLTSTDGMHDFVIDEFDAKSAVVQTGESTSITFVADEAGTFEFYCSIGQHRAMGMVGTLIVE